MKAYWVKTSLFIKKMFSGYIWDVPNNERKIYLTFDDGPTPEITDWVLQLLKKYSATASFFCIGKNILDNPELFRRIIANGHTIGNHTHNHLNGWKTPTASYVENFDACSLSISEVNRDSSNTRLFRPPYGKIKRSQAKAIKAKGYEIIMWDVLSADFDQSITKEKCLNNILSNIKPGSIVVFHDSVKAFTNLEYVLPLTLKFIEQHNYKYGVL
ncbi:MAG: polysaccharide deacetylase family protein [Flavobacteriaceae bacterium]|nr:polysaccharide deacetylase family protein [Flavobacteriaceae bacterium]